MIKFENPLNGRYYYIILQKDMLEHDVLTIIRGGKRSRVVRHFGFNSINKIQDEIQRLIKIRVKRGYRLV